MQDIVEKKVWKANGFAALLVAIVVMGASFWGLVATGASAESSGPSAAFIASMAAFILACAALGGFFVVQPNQAKVFTFFGRYSGSMRDSGFGWTNPLVKRKSVSLKARNFGSQVLKVNDALGNPIEIGAIVVWRVTDSAKALFNIDDYESFVTVQSETALRVLAGRFPYDNGTDDHAKLSLRANQDEIALELRKELHDRLDAAGVTIDEARLSHLAYAPEIAQAMLRRQQASAVIAARRLIVDGAVGMVKMALEDLESQGVVKLDNERRAAMVNNLLVALVSESEAQPVINTGTLYA
jgi:regulator of protease activity HflC (stomatin/prohibitin superfamily)